MWQEDTTVTFACRDIDAADADVVISGGSVVLAIVVGELVATSVVHGMVDPPRRQLLECVSLDKKYQSLTTYTIPSRVEHADRV
jgi:hypothetical protein